MEKKNNNKYTIGTHVRFRKKHPCGGDTWIIVRTGMDIKAKCEKCGRLVMMSRRKFEKNIKELLKNEDD